MAEERLLYAIVWLKEWLWKYKIGNACLVWSSLGLKCISINKRYCTTLISRYKRRRKATQTYLADSSTIFAVEPSSIEKPYRASSDDKTDLQTPLGSHPSHQCALYCLKIHWSCGHVISFWIPLCSCCLTGVTLSFTLLLHFFADHYLTSSGRYQLTFVRSWVGRVGCTVLLVVHRRWSVMLMCWALVS